MTTFGTVCSGIEAASVAWTPIGWHASWFSEISAFPSAVLAHHYPNTTNLGDMIALPRLIRDGIVSSPDVFTGGTPCQAFSTAGNRQSLSDDRGNLSLVFCEVADAIDDIRHSRGEQPAVILWENVPGVLNTSDNAFGCFLAQLTGEPTPLIAPSKRWPNAGIVVGPRRSATWRILDAQYFGLAQRRKRVFVVASARCDADIGQVLFDFGPMQVNHQPRREAWQADTASAEVSTNESTESGLTYSIGGNGIHTGELGNTPGFYEEISPAITTKHHAAIAFKVRGKGTYTGEKGGRIVNTKIFGGHGILLYEEKTFTIAAAQDQYIVDNQNVIIRRLTPRECERLQGFPDDYTLIPYAGKMSSDQRRYHALGNSWPVPVIRWIGQRIDTVFFSNSTL